jgi:hypothetical protein
MAETMTAERLPQNQPAAKERIFAGSIGLSGAFKTHLLKLLKLVGPKLVAETGILKQAARHLNFLFTDQDPARKDANRALEHAHILIGDEVPDACASEQGLDCRDQHSIGGANEFAHAHSPCSARRGSANCSKPAKYITTHDVLSLSRPETPRSALAV